MPFNSSSFRNGSMSLRQLHFSSQLQTMPEVLPLPPVAPDNSSLDMETVKKYAPYAIGAMALLFILTR